MKKIWLMLMTLSLSLTVQAEHADFNDVWQLAGNKLVELKTAEGKVPPLNKTAIMVYQQRSKMYGKGDLSYDAGQSCKPMGHPRLLWDEGLPFDIQVSPERILFGYTWNRLHRLVDVTDAALNVAGPTYLGTAVAQWQGDELVIKSGGYNQATLLDAAGMPHSYQLKITERYRLINDGKQLQLHIEFDDPETFNQSWSTELTFDRVPNGRIREDICKIRMGLYPEN